MKVAVGLGIGAAAAFGAYSLLKKQKPDGLVVGGLNMQYGPYKISRIAKDTTGLDPEKKQKILTFNNYCMGCQPKKNLEDAQLDAQQALQKIFGVSDASPDSYEAGLVKCLQWKQEKESGKWFVDVGATFKTYFDSVNHHLWTSAILDTTPQVAQEILATGVDIMALVETSAGIRNAKDEVIPHTDNLTKLVENLNKNGSSHVDFKIALYSQFTNPTETDFPHLGRGNAIIYNANSTNLLGSFVIELSSEKRGKVTTRRYPVGLFGTTEPTLAVCAAHVSGYAYKDGQKGGSADAVLVGDKELENVLRVLSEQLTPSTEITVSISGKSYKPDDPELAGLLKGLKFTSALPTIIIGDFNQDFSKNTIEYPHEYRFPTFAPHEGSTVAGRYGFKNGYSLANQIHPTTGYGATIDGFLTKNIDQITLLSKAYDPKTATSDHSAVYAKL